MQYRYVINFALALVIFAGVSLTPAISCAQSDELLDLVGLWGVEDRLMHGQDIYHLTVKGDSIFKLKTAGIYSGRLPYSSDDSNEIVPGLAVSYGASDGGTEATARSILFPHRFGCISAEPEADIKRPEILLAAKDVACVQQCNSEVRSCKTTCRSGCQADHDHCSELCGGSTTGDDAIACGMLCNHHRSNCLGTCDSDCIVTHNACVDACPER